MPPYKPMPYREVRRKLEKLGFTIVTQKGSYIKFAKYLEFGTITALTQSIMKFPPVL